MFNQFGNLTNVHVVKVRAMNMHSQSIIDIEESVNIMEATNKPLKCNQFFHLLLIASISRIYLAWKSHTSLPSWESYFEPLDHFIFK